jgi:hypothetical protein
MSMLQVASIVFGMAFSSAAVIFSAGVLVQKLKSHEELDAERFKALHKICEEIREDVKELRKAS